MERRVVVVGAGPGGLAASLLLAAGGAKVTVVERQDGVGGRTRTLDLGGGFRFDTGPTFFLYPRILREVMASAGFALEREVDLRRLDPQYRLLFGGGRGRLDATPDPQRMAAAIDAVSPGDGAGFARFLADNRQKLTAFKSCLERPWNGWLDACSPRMAGLLPTLAPWRSLWDDLGRWFRDDRIRLAFTFQSKYLGMSPYRCPSLFSILSFLEYEHGVWHPIGGCGAVMDALARCARALGVDIRTSAPVAGIRFTGRTATGVELEGGERLDADAVVVNADFAHAIPRLVPDRLRRRWSDKRIAKARYSCSTFMLYLGVDGACDHLAHHTIRIAPDYARNLREIENEHVLSDDPSFYVQNAAVTDPTLAPAGSTPLYVLVPVSHQHPNIAWKDVAPAFRRRVLDLVGRELAIPDLERRIRVERQITPDDWQAQAIHKGATFNLAHDYGQMLHLRPRNRADDLDGVYLVGGGTHPGSGLPVIFESARISSRLLLADLGLSTRHIIAPTDDYQGMVLGDALAGAR